MSILSAAKYALGVGGAAAILAACSSGSQLAPATPGMSTGAGQMNSQVKGQLDTLTVHNPTNLIVHTDHSNSWISPDAKGKSLLYISDYGSNDVYVYSYPKGTLVGTLTGFSGPQGLCSDAKGNVFVDNTNTSQVIEYAHGGTTPIATLSDPGQYNVGCSVNMTSGDLAVTNIISTTSGPGSLSIYAKAKGNPKVYSDPNAARMYFDAYDGNTLYVDGSTSGGTFYFAAFAKNKFTDLTVKGATINFPGGVFFDKVLTVGDQSGSNGTSIVYSVKVKGKTATVTGTTTTTATDCVQYTIDGKTLICPDAGQASVEFYKFPAGGSPTKTISGLSEPIGSAVSK